MNAYFDIQAVKNWYDSVTQTYQNKPSCLKIEFYQKIGTKTETRETKNFDGDDLKDLSKGDNNRIACERFSPEAGWHWLQNSINSFIPSGTKDLMISYYTSNGAAKSNFPISLNRKQDSMISSFNNISGFHNRGQNDLQTLIGMIANHSKPSKSEAELREEIRKDLERDRKIEDLEDYIENMRDEKMGALNKIGAILQTSPELAKGVGSGINMLFGVLGQQLGSVINGFAKGNTGPITQTASVGTIENENESIIITVDVALAEVQKQFPNENPIITIYKLAKVLEQNELFKPTILSMIKKIDI